MQDQKKKIIQTILDSCDTLNQICSSIGVIYSLIVVVVGDIIFAIRIVVDVAGIVDALVAAGICVRGRIYARHIHRSAVVTQTKT